jgi:hypothetical protein
MRAADQRDIRSRDRERVRREEARRAFDQARLKQARLQGAAAAARTSAWLDDRELDDLPWLVTEGNRIRDENGNDVYLRGVSATGLDTVGSSDVGLLRDQLGLGDSAIDVLTGLWNVTVVRIPFHAGTILTGTGGLTAVDLLSGLDELVIALAEAGAYTLLSLQSPPSPDDMAPLPGDDAVACWQALTTRYEDVPAVLYEIWSSPKPLAAGWMDAASVLVGRLRLNHPASLLFLGATDGGTSVDGLPLRFSTGQPVHNIVYTVRAARSEVSPANGQMLRLFARAFPLFVSEWSDVDTDLGRSADAAAALFDRLGMGWAASTWNAEPRLVIDALAGRFTSLPFGRVAQRGLALPVEPQTQPFPLLLPRSAQ